MNKPPTFSTLSPTEYAPIQKCLQIPGGPNKFAENVLKQGRCSAKQKAAMDGMVRRYEIRQIEYDLKYCSPLRRRTRTRHDELGDYDWSDHACGENHSHADGFYGI